MRYYRPKSGDLVWIEHEGTLRRAVYLVHSDAFQLGEGTQVSARQVLEWFDDLPESAPPVASGNA